MKWNITVCIASLLACTEALPQAQTDTAFATLAKANTIQLHQEALGGQARLYNGSKYRDPIITLDFHPFFISEDWITGSVFYDGEYYENVPLMYDLLNGVLVTEHYPSGHAIRLVSEKIQRFSIDGHNFRLIENSTVQNSLPRTAFYDVLYDGETRVVALRQKFRRDEVEALRIEVTYEEKNRYFILRNGVYFSVRSKGSVLKLMDDKKQQLRRLIKQNGLSFHDNRELALKSVAQFYDELK